jgi:hypothetical protein
MIDNSEKKCQQIYKNVIYAMAKYGKPSVFIRELFETNTCDNYQDLTEMRNAYHKKLGNDTLNRILSFEENTNDLRKAEYVHFHYYNWTLKTLYTAFDWKNKVWFYTGMR